MKERLYKLLRYWRDNGTKALIHRINLALKYKDPFRAAHQDAIDTRSPLNVFTIKSAQPPRVSIITDSVNRGSLYGGVGTALIMAAILTEARSGRLRIVTRAVPVHPGYLAQFLKTYGIKFSHEIEFVFAPVHGGSYELDTFSDELFITTSWWTTASAMASVPHDSIVYLLQEDERMFYPHGDDHLRCAQVLQSKSIHFVINTRLLFEHFIADGLCNIRERGIWFEPAFPRDVFLPHVGGNSGKRKLMFYARPNNPRNLFYFGAELIESAVTRGIIDLARWDIVLVGKDIPKMTFAGDYTPIMYANLSWTEYARMLGEIDLGLCLMYTPHPSYPPLDLAASGAVVVTNRFGIKQDLSNYSKNIICANLDTESMLAALTEGIRLAGNVVERAENCRTNKLGLDWPLAFSEVIQHFGKCSNAVS